MGTAEVLDLVDEWVRAERSGEADVMDRLLAPDFIAVGPRGFTLTKQQWLDRFRSGDLRNTEFELREPQLREYGAAAVVVGTQVQQATYQGHDASAELRTTLVAVRPAERWVLAGLHLSPIAGPPTPGRPA